MWYNSRYSVLFLFEVLMLTLRVLLVAIALSMSAIAVADYSLKDGRNEMTLVEDKPCTNPTILSLVNPNRIDEFKSKAHPGHLFLNGVTHYLCWIQEPEDTMNIFFEDGSGAPIPTGAFTRSKAL